MDAAPVDGLGGDGADRAGGAGAARAPAGGRRWIRPALMAALGALAGGLYAHFIGCRTGTCPLTSSVWTASLYGAFVGGAAGWPGRPPPAERRG